MKYTVALGFLLSGLVAAQSAPTATGLVGLISQLPTCALRCLSSAAKDINCAPTDFTCLCKSGEKLIASLTPCVLTAGCSSTDISTAAKIAPQICPSVQDDPAAPAVASASNLIGGALSTATASKGASATAVPAAAVRPEMCFGMIGAVALGAAML